MNWGLEDVAALAVMLIVAGGAFWLATRLTASRRNRALAGLGIAAAFVLVWAELAVGILP